MVITQKTCLAARKKKMTKPLSGAPSSPKRSGKPTFDDSERVAITVYLPAEQLKTMDLFVFHNKDRFKSRTHLIHDAIAAYLLKEGVEDRRP